MPDVRLCGELKVVALSKEFKTNLKVRKCLRSLKKKILAMFDDDDDQKQVWFEYREMSGFFPSNGAQKLWYRGSIHSTLSAGERKSENSRPSSYL